MGPKNTQCQVLSEAASQALGGQSMPFTQEFLLFGHFAIKFWLMESYRDGFPSGSVFHLCRQRDYEAWLMSPLCSSSPPQFKSRYFPASTFFHIRVCCAGNVNLANPYTLPGTIPWHDSVMEVSRLCVCSYTLNKCGLCLGKCIKTCPIHCICPKWTVVKFYRHFDDDEKETGSI